MSRHNPAECGKDNQLVEDSKGNAQHVGIALQDCRRRPDETLEEYDERVQRYRERRKQYVRNMWPTFPRMSFHLARIRREVMG